MTRTLDIGIESHRVFMTLVGLRVRTPTDPQTMTKSLTVGIENRLVFMTLVGLRVRTPAPPAPRGLYTSSARPRAPERRTLSLHL